jgi:hypothetical protein
MGAVTYPDPRVARMIAEHFVPVQFDVVAEPEVMDRYNTPWTPTLIVEDADGKEHRRSQGYLDPHRFLEEMSLAWLKAAIDRRNFGEAQRRAPEALELTKGDTFREPEAIYWSAVADYKATNDPQNLMRGWNHLLDAFPTSEWAKKAEFIRM